MYETLLSPDARHQYLPPPQPVAIFLQRPGWLEFFRNLTARRLAGVALVASDAHRRRQRALGRLTPVECETIYSVAEAA
jgi:hypothetical protein